MKNIRNWFPPYGTDFTILGVSIHDDDKNTRRYKLVKPLFRLVREINNVYFDIVNRLRRAHIVDTKQGYGWHDVDDLMFHACFQLLNRFVEKELGVFKLNGWGSEPYRGFRLHSEGDERAVDLWWWYNGELPEIERAVAEDLHYVYGDRSIMTYVDSKEYPGLKQVVFNSDRKISRFEYDYLENLKDTKLKELMAIRRCLWT